MHTPRSPQRRRSVGARHAVDDLIRLGNQVRKYPSCEFAYFRVIDSIRRQTDLLRAGNLQNTNGELRCGSIILGAISLCETHRHWLRAPEFYVPPKNASLMDQWIGFAQHLFEAYPCPKLLSVSWLSIHHPTWWRRVHLHLGQGKSLRKFARPDGTHCDKATARFFMIAPDDLNPGEALRWAQIRAIAWQTNTTVAQGYVRRLMTAMPICEDRAAERAWEDTIRFLIRNPVDRDTVEEIVEMVRMIRLMPAERVYGVYAGTQPIDPTFTLRARTLKNVRNLVVHWRERFQQRFCRTHAPVDKADLAWARYPVDDARLEIESPANQACWEIVQLITAKQLRTEGGILNHCVGGYAHRCMRGRSSIWSLRLRTGETCRRHVTIELQPSTRKIIFAAGKNNRSPNDQERSVILKWALSEGFQVCERSQL